jgi:hypothetical protein
VPKCEELNRCKPVPSYGAQGRNIFATFIRLEVMGERVDISLKLLSSGTTCLEVMTIKRELRRCERGERIN